MQRKTFLFFAKLNRYVTCLRYGVSKGQHEPGWALWPCHFKNKYTSASTTAEVKMFSYKPRGWQWSGFRVKPDWGDSTSPCVVALKHSNMDVYQWKVLVQGLKLKMELPRSQIDALGLITTSRQWFTFPLKCCQKSSVLFTFACQHDNRGLHESHILNALARMPSTVISGVVVEGRWCRDHSVSG